MFIAPLILAVVVAAIALIIAGIRAGESSDEGGRNMIKNVYIYLVLFATLMMTIGGSVGTFMAVADIVAPAPFYYVIEDYKRTVYDLEGKDISEAELQQRYQAAAEAHKAQQVERAKNQLIRSLGWIVIPLPVFIYFQRRLAGKEA
jgi:Ca2+/Na+ antiporter